MLRRPADPVAVLRDLVALYDLGRGQPIPLPVKTSFAWSTARHKLRTGDHHKRYPPDPEKDARRKWLHERDDPAVERIWGKKADLAVLLGVPAPHEEADGENTRLGAYAARLWMPLLQSEGAAG